MILAIPFLFLLAFVIWFVSAAVCAQLAEWVVPYVPFEALHGLDWSDHMWLITWLTFLLAPVVSSGRTSIDTK